MTDLYEWNADYSVGSKTLDTQHQKLCELCKQISDYQCDGSERSLDVFRAMLNDLMFYIDKHFQTEEDALRFTGYPKFEEHKKEHEAYKKQIAEFLGAAMARQIDKDALQGLLGKWWSNHILVCDMQYRSSVTKNLV